MSINSSLRHLIRPIWLHLRHQHQAASSVNRDLLDLTIGPTTGEIRFLDTNTDPCVPAYRVLDERGRLVSDLDESLDSEKQLRLYENMVRLNTMDKILFDSQRQGRISFYMTSFGEEAAQLGSAAGLEPQDWVFAQYREAGVLLQRGMSIKLMLAQCFGNRHDFGTKGRQMPIHYGKRSLNYVTISSPLATQMPQAAGAAYAFKIAKDGRIAVCYFGEGAASEGDAHAALNFAATLDCPVVFICRNNGYAISTPASEQFKTDGLVRRASGYGIKSIRVDGNDLFAMFSATKAARDLSARESRPVFIEAMTYRMGHHSTSDDSSAYRKADEVKAWESQANPIERVKAYLHSTGAWNESLELKLREQTRAEVLEALQWAGQEKKLPISSMFEDVLEEVSGQPDKLTGNLARQRDQLKSHLDRFGQHYPMNEHEGF